MKETLKSVLIAALGMTAMACSDDIQESHSASNITHDDYSVSLESALSTADAFLSEMDKASGNETRSSRRTVRSVEKVGTNTRSGSELFYLVNYDDDMGFAMLAADSRLDPIYAISDEGHFNMSDTVGNPGLQIFLEGATAEANGIVTGGEVSMPKYFDSYKLKYGPYLSWKVSRWGQSGVYSSCLDPYPELEAKGKNKTVGCSAIATAQVCSFKKYPSKFTYRGTEYTLDWDTINSPFEGDDDANILWFLAYLCQEEFKMDWTYGLEDTYTHKNVPGRAYVAYYEKVFQNLGYKPFKYNKWVLKDNIPIIESLLNPEGLSSDLGVLMRSENGVILTSGQVKTGGGHSWVIDGYAVYYYRTKLWNSNGFSARMESSPLMHCVWGNWGTANGFFKWNSSNDTMGGEPELTDRDLDNEEKEARAIYDNGVFIYAGIRVK